MSTTLENAPLVELIAEVRWPCSPVQGIAPSGGSVITGGFLAAPLGNNEFFDHFSASVHAEGYSRSERLVPLGSPEFPHQAVYRFKKSDEQQTTSLYQLGPGIFSANAVPPYESWREFDPVIRRGVECLLAARGQADRHTPFSSLSLRYIDLFRPELTEGRTVDAFIREVFKIDVSLPHALAQHVPQGEVARPFLQFQLPMNGGFVMNFAVGEGIADGKPGIIMDTSVATTVEVAPNVNAVMENFIAAHNAIDVSFRALIEPIAHLMPKKGAS
jgi:uncharacterized protein (TIGR04255 family)